MFASAPTRDNRTLLAELGVLALLAATTAVFSPPVEGRSAATEPGADGQHAELVAWFTSHSPALSEAERNAAAHSVAREARRHGFDVELVLAVIEVESGGDAFAFSHAGAVGLMQLRPVTAEETARRIGVDWRGAASLTDPEVNIRLGAAYLRSLVERFGGIGPALAAYNLGPTRVASRLARGAPVPVAYMRRVERAFGHPLARSVRLL